jgi:hypothetical protein
MKYQTPEIVELGTAEQVVLGALKMMHSDGNDTGVALDYVDEEVE